MISVITYPELSRVQWLADNIEVERGVLLVMHSDVGIVATYAPGQWACAYREDQSVKKP